MKTVFQTITKDNKTMIQAYSGNYLIDETEVPDFFDMDGNKRELFNYMKGNVYWAEKISQRVKIRTVSDSGKCIVYCKDGKYRQAYIGDLKRVCSMFCPVH